MASFDNAKVLSTDSLTDIVDYFAASFDAELSKITVAAEFEQLLTVSLSYYFENHLYSFITNKNLLNKASTIFENTLLRDFLLNLSARFYVTIQGYLVNDFSLEKTIALGLGNDLLNKEIFIEEEPVLLPRQFLFGMQNDTEEIFNILSYNRWVMMIVLITMHLNRTSTFESYAKANKTRKE